jgi:biopolymer transport protein ExbB
MIARPPAPPSVLPPRHGRALPRWPSALAALAALTTLVVATAWPAAALAAEPGSVAMNPFDAAMGSRGMVLFVLVVLLLMSVLSWFIIGARSWALWKLRGRVQAFHAIYERHDDMTRAAEALKAYVGVPHFALLARTLKTVARAPADRPVDLAMVERVLQRTSEPLVAELESGLSTLATIASAAPFIGLFGTVWGIMLAFGDVSDTASVLQTVAPHIAEALVATAVGLLAAIPAVIAYNGLGRVVSRLVADLDGFGLDLLNRVATGPRGPVAVVSAPPPAAAETLEDLPEASLTGLDADTPPDAAGSVSASSGRDTHPVPAAPSASSASIEQVRPEDVGKATASPSPADAGDAIVELADAEEVGGAEGDSSTAAAKPDDEGSTRGKGRKRGRRR